MELETEQMELLVRLVEAERSIPRSERQEFIIAETVGPPGVDLIHPGIPNGAPRVFKGDIEILARAGFISMSHLRGGLNGFYVTPAGLNIYGKWMESKGTPIGRVEAKIRTFLDSELFQRQYPVANRKWSEAEKMLWGVESSNSATTIGHLIRESMQEFADTLITLFPLQGIAVDKAKTVSRIRAVIEFKGNKLGKTEEEFLKALLAYWGTVSDLAQRQEHGSQHEGRELQWEDSRRLVFQTAMVMFEIDAALVSLK